MLNNVPTRFAELYIYIYDIYIYIYIYVLRPLTNDLWVFLFQTIDAEYVK